MDNVNEHQSNDKKGSKKKMLIIFLSLIVVVNIILFVSKNQISNFVNSDEFTDSFSTVDTDRDINQCPEKKTLEKQLICYQEFVLRKPINTTYLEELYIKDKNADNYIDECVNLKDSKNKIYCRAAVAIKLRDPKYCIKESVETGTECLMMYSGKLNAPEVCDLMDDSYGKIKEACIAGGYY